MKTKRRHYYTQYIERHAKTEYDTLYVYDTRFYICHSLSIYLRGFMVQLVITSLLRSEGPRFEPGWNHFYLPDHPFSPLYLSTLRLDYPFRPLSLVGSYQVGYTRSHPNTEVKMLRACSVPLCSHRWERQVIYLLFFLIFPITIRHDITITRDITVSILDHPCLSTCTRCMRVLSLTCAFLLFPVSIFFLPFLSKSFHMSTLFLLY